MNGYMSSVKHPEGAMAGQPSNQGNLCYINTSGHQIKVPVKVRDALCTYRYSCTWATHTYGCDSTLMFPNAYAAWW
jgi:hypothetical protein